jgi:hypothetical protein
MFDSILNMLGLGKSFDFKQLMQNSAILIDLLSVEAYPNNTGNPLQQKKQ